MATFTPVTLAEMDEHLGAEWTRTLEGTGSREWVYQRPLTAKVNIKVWSSLGANGQARKKGSDAIRVCATLTKASGQTVGYIKSVRVHRVEGWRDNLTARITTVTAEAQKRIDDFKAKYGYDKPKQTSTKYPALSVPAMPAELKTKKARIEWLRETIKTNVAMAYEVLTTIFDMQTAEEQASDMTVEHNGVGFSGTDAEFLSSVAKQLIGKQEKYGKDTAYLSAKQTEYVQKIMPKYARQYLDLTSIPVAVPAPQEDRRAA